MNYKYEGRINRLKDTKSWREKRINKHRNMNNNDSS